jgi:bacteriorhodopsin
VLKVFIEVFLEYCVPVTFYETNGSYIVWVRYAEWLLTCPVRPHAQ